MDLDAWKVAISLAALVFSIGAAIYAHHRTRDQAWKEELEARKKEQADLQERVTRAEARLEETPTSKALHELALSITEFGGELRTVAARMEGLGAIVQRLEKVTLRQEEYIHDLNRKGGP